MHRSTSTQLYKLRVMLLTAIAGAVLGAIAAVSARSLLSPTLAAVPVCAQCGAPVEPSVYYYFPSQFEAPQGPVERSDRDILNDASD